MATNSPDPEPEEPTEETHHNGERPLSEGCSRFSRSRIDSSFEEYLSNKEAKRSEGTSKIQSGRGGLSSGSSLRRVSINKVSKKGRKKRQEYAKASKEHYQNDENKRCALCGSQRNLSIHHIKKRLEGNHAEKETFITLCLTSKHMDERYPESNHSHSGGCHGWTHGNPSLAKELGLLI